MPNKRTFYSTSKTISCPRRKYPYVQQSLCLLFIYYARYYICGLSLKPSFKFWLILEAVNIFYFKKKNTTPDLLTTFGCNFLALNLHIVFVVLNLLVCFSLSVCQHACHSACLSLSLSVCAYLSLQGCMSCMHIRR